MHLLLVTKYRHPVFTAEHLECTEDVMLSVCADFSQHIEHKGRRG